MYWRRMGATASSVLSTGKAGRRLCSQVGGLVGSALEQVVPLGQQTAPFAAPAAAVPEAQQVLPASQQAPIGKSSAPSSIALTQQLLSEGQHMPMPAQHVWPAPQQVPGIM